MKALKGNKLVPVLAVVSLIIIAGLFLRSGKPEKFEPMKAVPTPEARTPDGDTTADTVRTLTAEMTHVKEEVRKKSDENDKLKAEREELIKNREKIEENVTRNLAERMARPEASGMPAFASMSARIDNLTNVIEKLAPGTVSGDKPVGGAADKSDMPPGLGFKPGTGAGGARPVAASGEIKWIEPLGRKIAINAQGKPDMQSNGEPKLVPSAYSAAQPAVAHADVQSPAFAGVAPGQPVPGAGLPPDQAFSQGQQISTAVPYFTVPENATLLNASAMTAILGRIPVQGNVRDPMEFKVLIGRPNLAANGLDVPSDVYGMVVTGTAIGDWNLQCVEGHIYSVTFLFADGSIRTISKRRGGQSLTGTNNSQRLGYISDERGVPCISGQLVTNAPWYLTQIVGIKAIEAAASAAAAAQTTTTVSPLTGGSTSSVTGDQTKFILGQAATAGFDEVSKWMLKRLNDSFDAVYVSPGMKVAVHITEELTLDKDPNARRLDYGKANFSTQKRYRALD